VHFARIPGLAWYGELLAFSQKKSSERGNGRRLQMAAEEDTRECVVAPGKKPVGKKRTPKLGPRERAIQKILNKLEKQLINGELKGTVADYLKLIQVGKEIAEARPRAIEITWVNSLREESGE
jgi:hypothetical protein